MFKVLALVALGLVLVAASKPLTDSDYETMFVKYTKDFNKVYKHSEFFSRYHAFRTNVNIINAWNAKKHSSTMGINKFSDLTNAEFKKLYTGLKFPKVANAKRPQKPMVGQPAALDWVSKGRVVAVKDQGQCGSCYSFSASGSMESAWAIKKNIVPVSLSEEQAVDCSGNFGNQGCNGGLMSQVFQYIINNTGICSEAAYPYVAGGGSAGDCGIPPAGGCPDGSKYAAAFTSFKSLAASETDLMNAIQLGPVSVAIEADQSVFQSYTGGIISADAGCGTQLDHGVLLVGYGVDATTGMKFWRIKNSWASSWGDNGYVRIERQNAAYPQGTCGIANDWNTYPIV